MLNAEYFTKTLFVVSDHKEMAVCLALSEESLDYEVVRSTDPMVSSVGFSIYAVDTDKVASILANAKIRLQAVNDDVNGELDEVERAPVLSCGQAENPNLGSLHSRLPVKASIQDGDILNVAEFFPTINDWDLNYAVWNSINGTDGMSG